MSDLNTHQPSTNGNSKPSSTTSSIDSLKTSSFDRRLSMAKTSLNIGRRWASSSISNLFVDKTTRETRKQAFMSEQANYLVTEIGKLKGSVVKIGQMMALYGEHLLPEDVTRALHGLNDNTATLNWQAIKPLIQQQLGEKMNELVIQTMPIGTASLAQVHRATVKATGEQLVLKIQYPGVADAIDSDLSMFTNLLKISNAVPQTRSFDAWISEIRNLLYREVDYAQEIKTTKEFYERLSTDSRYVVPKIVDKYCTKKIICMSYEQGLHITDEHLRQLSQDRRNAIGQSAIEIVLGEIFTWGEMQTDPNFGNYLIRVVNNEQDIKTSNAEKNTTNTVVDQLVLLDFGAIREFDNNLLTIARGLMSAGFEHDKTAMLAAMKNSNYEFFANMSEVALSDMADVFLLATEPFSNPKKNPQIPANCLDKDGKYIWANSELHARLMERTRSATKSLEFSVPPKEFMFISRKFIGAYTLLTVLDARTDAKDFLDSMIQN